MSSILSTVPLYVLSNSPALNHLLDDAGKSLDWRLWAYSAFMRRDSSRPDHVFMKRWELFEKKGGYTKQEQEIDLMKAIEMVAEGYLEISNGRLYVRNYGDEPEEESGNIPTEAAPKYAKSAHFDRWQNIRARMTTWPMKFYMLYRYHRPADYFLAHPQEPMVADFIRTEGLNETHLHLNGCLYPEIAWLQALYTIPSFLREIRKKWKKRAYHEHYMNVNSRLNPLLVANRLKLAAVLRDSILCLEKAGLQEQKEAIIRAEKAIRRYSLNPKFFFGQVRLSEVPKDLQKRKQQEMLMWMRAFRLLEKDSDFRFKRKLQYLLHLYLLLQNEHIHLNCHTENRKGFEAFNTANDHPKPAVKTADYYESTFYHLLKSAEAQGHNFMEVRVSPSGLWEKHEMYLHAYERAWRRWEKEQKSLLRMKRELPQQSITRPQLVLVAHLIKDAPKPLPNAKGILFPPLFAAERTKHLREASDLAQVARHLMTQHRIPVAIDAANSELNQAPEVFAPAYRLFETLSGVAHKTYHCGEDFLHLISGVRAVYEAVTFLNLRNGNRIGHGTAVGILPEEWLESMPAKLLLSRRDWLLDMIFVWKMLHEVNPTAAEKAEREAVRVAGLIFTASPKNKRRKSSTDTSAPLLRVKIPFLRYNSIHTLSDFFEMRQFEPTYVRQWLDKQLPLSAAQVQEWNLMKKKAERFGRLPAELYWQWNIDPAWRDAQEEIIEVKRDFLTEAELLELQQRVQHLIATRDVVIETLPVSNMRISQFCHIQDHHVLRWLKVEGYKKTGDADMNICVGSDDPGIFATDIKNEYYHLYMSLRNAGLSAQRAVELLRKVNEAGRVYAFRKLPDMKPTPFKLSSLLNNTPRSLTLWERVERYSKHREQEGREPYHPPVVG